MRRFLQEFFWTPDETVSWIQRVASSFALWTVVWTIDRDAERFDPAAIQLEMFTGLTEDEVQLFLGSPAICREPVWRPAGRRRLLDFQRSYAIQLVPPTLAPDGKTLLQGRLGILCPDKYEDPERSEQLSALFNRIQTSMKQESDSSRVIVQDLTGGGRKTWKTMLVGRAVPKTGVLELKQHAKGGAVFRVEPVKMRCRSRFFSEP